MLGMVKVVSSEMFLSFARGVAVEGCDVTSSSSALTKSKVLVQHLYTMPCELRDPILAEIIDVPFVACEPASHELLNLCQQVGIQGS